MKKIFSFVIAAFACVMFANADGNTIVSTARVTFSNSPVGTVNGNAKFTVGKNKQVYFSQGNLQFRPSDSTWYFAKRQYDVMIMDSATTGSPSATTASRIDYFQFGNSGCVYKNKWFPAWWYNSNSASSNNRGYYDYAKNIQFTNMDWGVYNKIKNGGDAEGQWRTLSRQEWDTLINRRPMLDGNNPRYAAAYIKNIKTAQNTTISVRGFILFPDVWNRPASVDVTYGASDAAYQANQFDTAQWRILENAGAVFMPCNGYRDYNGYLNSYSTATSDSYGYYWTSTAYTNQVPFQMGTDDNAYYMYFRVYPSSSYTKPTLSYTSRYQGYSVRLVQDVPAAFAKPVVQ